MTVMSQTKEAVFLCEKCGTKVTTFSSAAVWCPMGHRMMPKEDSNGKASK